MKPDPRLIQFVDHGEPGKLATEVFCTACALLVAADIIYVILILCGVYK